MNLLQAIHQIQIREETRDQFTISRWNPAFDGSVRGAA